QIMQGNVKAPAKSTRVPKRFHDLIVRGLAARPDNRHPSMAALLKELERDPTATRRRAAGVVTAVLLVGAAVLGYSQVRRQQMQVCKGAGAKLAGVWDVDRKHAVSKAFLATGRPYAQDAVRSVGQILDRYAAAWATMHTEACEATRLRGEQSEDL